MTPLCNANGSGRETPIGELYCCDQVQDVGLGDNSNQLFLVDHRAELRVRVS